MSFIRKLFFVLLLLLFLLAAIGLFLPTSAHVQRSLDLNASAQTIFPHLNSMKAFNKWSPWTQIDASTEYRFEGPDQGVGSKMIWVSSNAQVGDGSQVISKSIANKMVETKLDFGNENTGTATFELQNVNAKTRISWHFRAEFGWDLFSRYIGYFVLDRMVGGSYEKGLRNLQQIVDGNSSN